MYAADAKNEENLAQERALAICAFVEHFEDTIKDYAAFVKDLPKEYQVEAEVYLTKLQGIYNSLDDPENEIASAVINTTTIKEHANSKIKRLNLGKDIIRLYEEQGLSVNDIATRCGLSRSTIKRFIQVYYQAAPTERNRITKTNVFDLENNMQNLYANLLRQAARYDNDGEVSAKFLSEQRQLLGFVERYLKENNAVKKMEKIVLVIQEILAKYVPSDVRPLIFEEFKKIGISGMLPVETKAKRLP